MKSDGVIWLNNNQIESNLALKSLGEKCLRVISEWNKLVLTESYSVCDDETHAPPLLQAAPKNYSHRFLLCLPKCKLHKKSIVEVLVKKLQFFISRFFPLHHKQFPLFPTSLALTWDRLCCSQPSMLIVSWLFYKWYNPSSFDHKATYLLYSFQLAAL